MSPPTPPPEFIHVSSITAALAKLDLNIPLEDLLKLIKDEDEARRAEMTAKRRAALRSLALEPIDGPPVGLGFTTVSKFVPNPTEPISVDPLWNERCRRLVELTKQAFPDGKVPDPYTIVSPHAVKKAAANKLSFTSRIVVTSDTDSDTSLRRPQSVSENVWCNESCSC
ncbi:hypothetical protein BD410DRAFT_795915 [Rickenella mellea]|uniref:Uncharacterized protein n=1 Tax=Rickenella mellea TaxID=50990 RepID=A0A4Y7PMV7_9AGAM|nr:hypothetical protein BD410DRAFT_795915 [Rickenella mellea]